MKGLLRKKVVSRRRSEAGGWGWSVRKGKEVRRGLGSTRRISPLQRILSALHLFQDVVFPLRRESHTPSLLSRAPSHPFSPHAASATFATDAEMSSAPPFLFFSHWVERAIYFTYCDSEMVNWRFFLSRLSSSYDVLRTLYLSICWTSAARNKTITDKSIIHLKGWKVISNIFKILINIHT